MDGHRFDEITRQLAAGASRRRVLKGLAGGAMAAGLAVVGGRGPAAAQACKRTGKACKKDRQCCSGNCVGGTGGRANDGTCRPGGCAGDWCQDRQSTCGETSGCICMRTAADEGFCTTAEGTCLTTDCSATGCAAFGAGWACIKTGPHCCDPGQEWACVEPCPSGATAQAAGPGARVIRRR